MKILNSKEIGTVNSNKSTLEDTVIFQDENSNLFIIQGKFDLGYVTRVIGKLSSMAELDQFKADNPDSVLNWNTNKVLPYVN